MVLAVSSPLTGRRIKHGRALSGRTVDVQLPAVNALFQSIKGRSAHKDWTPNPAAADRKVCLDCPVHFRNVSSHTNVFFCITACWYDKIYNQQ